jgi:hypothetical protein
MGNVALSVEKQKREESFEATKWNKTLIYFANIYEPMLITICLAMSLYFEDTSTIFF